MRVPPPRTGRGRSPSASARWCGSGSRAAAGSRRATASDCAREIATLRRLREKRNSRLRGRSSPLEVAIEKKTTGASCPWNLSTVPTRARRPRRAAQAAHLGVVGRDDEDVVPAEAVLAPVAVGEACRRSAVELGGDPVGLLERGARGCPRARPGASAGRSPRARASRSAAARSSVDGVEPALVGGLGDEAADVGVHPPGASRGRGRGRPGRCRRRRAGARAPRPARRRGGSPARPGASCCGSPSRTTLRAQVPSASASASETCPASSTKSVSTTPAMSSREKSHAVPAEEQHVVVGLREVRLVRRGRDEGPVVGVALLQPAERDALLAWRRARPRRAGCGSPCGSSR